MENKVFKIVHEMPEVHICSRVIKQAGDTLSVVKVLELAEKPDFLLLLLADGTYINNIHKSLIEEVNGDQG